jgi:DNA-binding response OmpR family regulator
LKVLLVDDEKEMVSALAERLSFRDIDAEWVTTGKDAIALIGKNHFDVLVLDVKMPGMSGLETMKEILKIKPGSKIIFLTGHGSALDQFACKEAGAFSYLMKPINIETLVEKMKEAMDG